LEELAAGLVDRAGAVVKQALQDAKLGPEDIDEVVLVGGQTRMPLVQDLVRRIFGKEPSKGIHPDEAVALGAAIQAHAIEHRSGDVLLLDVTPHSLGIMVAGGFRSVLVPRNTTIPTSATHSFTTVRDNQERARILVLQGESEKAKDNEMLGELHLVGLRRAKRGEVEIEVRFEITADGIVSVEATDRGTGAAQFLEIQAYGGLAGEELEAIVERERNDQLLHQGEEASREQEEKAKRLIEKIERLLPEVREILRESTFGEEAIGKIQGCLRKSRGWLETGEGDGAAHLERLAETADLCVTLQERREDP
jgi:molecular chaperone DnaK